MKRLFARNFFFSAAAHAAIIVTLLFLSYFSCRSRRPAPELITFVDLRVVAPVEKAGPPGPVKDRPVPDVPESKPITQPKPKTIDVSNRVVKRDPLKPEWTQEEIRKMLDADEPRARREADPDVFANYLVYVRAVMHEAWRQPAALSGASGLIARARIRVRNDGRVERREIVRDAGNELMDASVMTALEAVEQLRPLPPGRGAYEDITIDFELTLP